MFGMRKFSGIFLAVFLTIFLPVQIPAHAFSVPSEIIQEAGANTEEYACPMHPEVKSKVPGKCTKCGMLFTKMTAGITGEFPVRIEASPKKILPGQTTTLRFVMLHPQTKQPVRQFNVIHEKLFHFFVVSHDFSHFEHLHPELNADGSFSLELILPTAGLFHVYSDIFPVGGVAQVSHQMLITDGFKAAANELIAPLNPDESSIKTVEGITFKKDFAPTRLVENQAAVLRYTLTDEKTGEPISDLQPYLGAWGHTLILSEDASNYLHCHPVEAAAKNGKAPAVIYFETFFPRAGKYRIWSQFRRQEKIVTVSFDVTVFPPQ
jgi:hypothetical protein